MEINGRRALNNFDICHAARGPHRAYECVFRYLVPDAEGNLVLRFLSGWDPQQKSHEAIVQAIEVLSEQKSVVRIDAGSPSPFVDWNGYSWAADGSCGDGRVLESVSAVAQASPTIYDQQLYRTARAGKTIQYKVPVKDGLYVVHLKFAELWLDETGKRPLDIAINGRTVWEAWDPPQEDCRAPNAPPTGQTRGELKTADEFNNLVVRAEGATSTSATAAPITATADCTGGASSVEKSSRPSHRV